MRFQQIFVIHKDREPNPNHNPYIINIMKEILDEQISQFITIYNEYLCAQNKQYVHGDGGNQYPTQRM